MKIFSFGIIIKGKPETIWYAWTFLTSSTESELKWENRSKNRFSSLAGEIDRWFHSISFTFGFNAAGSSRRVCERVWVCSLPARTSMRPSAHIPAIIYKSLIAFRRVACARCGHESAYKQTCKLLLRRFARRFNIDTNKNHEKLVRKRFAVRFGAL